MAISTYPRRDLDESLTRISAVRVFRLVSAGLDDFLTFSFSITSALQSFVMADSGDITSESTGRNYHKTKLGKEHWVCILFYLIVFVLVGLPIWFITTSPLRSSLPDIESLKSRSKNIAHKIHITVVTTDPDQYEVTARKSLRQQLSSQLTEMNSTDGSLHFHLDWKVRPYTPQEESRLFNSDSLSLLELDESLSKIQSHSVHGRLWIYLVNSTYLQSNPVKFGSYRFIYINSDTVKEPELASTIMQTVRSAIDPTETLVDPSASSNGPVMSHTPLESEVSVFVNIIIENAHDWKTFVESSKYDEVKNVTEYIMYESGIESLLKLRVSTQTVLYALEADFINRITKSSSNESRLIDTKDESLISKKIESRVSNPGSRAGSTCTFQVNLIIPSSQLAPLKFIHYGDTSNLLITSSKTGYIFWNEPDDMNVALKYFIRNLIGLSGSKFLDDKFRSQVLISSSNLFSRWEINSIARFVVQEQIIESINSLASVENLLDKVSNMVILASVSQMMHTAVDMCHKSIDDLSVGRLETALTLSSRAFDLSQRSFFDQSLLSLLYFPDDQKYAVYCPLFLPVSIPILNSLLHIIRHTRQNKATNH